MSPHSPTPQSPVKKHKRADRSSASPSNSHPSSPTSSGSKVVLDPLPTHSPSHLEQHDTCSCAAPSAQQLQQPFTAPFGFPAYPQFPVIPHTILIPTPIQTGSVPSLPWGVGQIQQLQQQQLASNCTSCPIHHQQSDVHRHQHHQRSNSDSPTRHRLSKHAPLTSASPPASASPVPTSPTRIAREKSPVHVHASDDASTSSNDDLDGSDTELAETTSTILEATVASLVHDLVLVEYAQAKLDQVRTTKQFPWSTSPRDPLAHLAASLLNEVVVQETRHLVRVCIHDAVLAKLKRDATDRACEALIEQCVREVVVSTVAEVESEAAAAAAGAESGGIVARASSQGEAEGVQQAGGVLKALVADELLGRYFGTVSMAGERNGDVASLWPVLLALVADQLLDRM